MTWRKDEGGWRVEIPLRHLQDEYVKKNHNLVYSRPFAVVHFFLDDEFKQYKQSVVFPLDEMIFISIAFSSLCFRFHFVPFTCCFIQWISFHLHRVKSVRCKNVHEKCLSETTNWDVVAAHLGCDSPFHIHAIVDFCCVELGVLGEGGWLLEESDRYHAI